MSPNCDACGKPFLPIPGADFVFVRWQGKNLHAECVPANWREQAAAGATPDRVAGNITANLAAQRGEL